MRELLLVDLPVTETRLDVDGIDTVVLEGGDGPPIVLLHGVASFAPEWGRVIPELVGSYRVVVPDLPGLGESVAPAGRLDAAVAVAWLQDLIAQTCAEPPTIVGHSVGGAIAAHFAIGHGDSVHRIVLVDCSSLGRFRPAPGVVVALFRYGACPNPANRDRFLRQVLPMSSALGPNGVTNGPRSRRTTSIRQSDRAWMQPTGSWCAESEAGGSHPISSEGSASRWR